MSLSIPFPFWVAGWLLNKKAARVEVKILLAFLHWEEAVLRGERGVPLQSIGHCAIICAKAAEPIQLPFGL